jgi:hypothetical protein
MSNLYQDAILDAKALRASAMANAKAALEEAFEPKIQEMLRLKLTEELDEIGEVEESMDGIEEDMKEESYDETMEENSDINEAELEEILAELEKLSATEGSYDEPMEEDSLYESLNEEDEEENEDAEEEADGEEMKAGKEVMLNPKTKVIDITLGQLKKVLQSVMDGDQEGMDLGMDQDASDEEAVDAEAESDITLDEILAELENEAVEEVSDAKSEAYGHSQAKQRPTMQEKKKPKEDKELEEAKATINVLRQNLQEVNLLNAKYLYMNKLFKSKSLSESQKVKVVNALDRASNVAEVKNTYETLKESFSGAKKTQLKESIGFASQAAGVAPKANIVDSDPFVSRWKTLAGIK